MTARSSREWPVVGALTRFWSSDRGLSIFSVFLLVVIFVLPPFVAPGTGRSLLGDLTFALLLISGVLALSERGTVWLILMATAIVAVAVDLGRWIVPVSEQLTRLTSLVSLTVASGQNGGADRRPGDA